METRYASKNEVQQQEIGELRLEVEELKQVISKKTEDILKLSQNLQSMKEANNSLLNIHSECDKKINYMRKTMDENSANLTAINEALVRKLQLSYEKEAELEIVKNEAQEKYDYALKAGSEAEKKVAILERSLDQLSTVQKQASILPNSSICLCILHFFYLACRTKSFFEERNFNS